jgi:hypothetical protein
MAETYINNLKGEGIFVPENIQFINAFTESSKDKGFSFFLQNGKKIDRIMNNRGMSRGIVDKIIAAEEVAPLVTKEDGYSDFRFNKWKEIEEKISKKYSLKLAKRVVNDAKIEWYANNKDWPQHVKYVIVKVKKYLDPKTSWYDYTINSLSWNSIFMHSTNKNEIKIAIRWMKKQVMKKSLNGNPNEAAAMDTYANLLYKAGRSNEAINWEERALEIAVKYKTENFISEFKNNLERMKKNEPTWIDQRKN